MPNEKIIVIDKVEPLLDKDNVIGRLVTDKAGLEHKVKKGQGGKLEARWEELDNAQGKAVKLIMSKFKPPGSDKTFDFVADFEFVTNIFEQKAAEKMQESQASNRERSYALSYAKDLVVADRIKVDDILQWADKFYGYLLGKETIMGVIIDETKTFKKTKGTKEVPTDEAEPTTTGVGGEEIDEVIAQLKKIKWTQVGVARWLNETFNIPKTQDVMSMIGQLTPENMEMFKKEIEGRKEVKNV